MASGRLPNILIAGVPKAGTTSLFAYLVQHPDICGSDEKELAYFNPLRHGRPLPPVETYEQHFAHCSDQRYALEATPSYCYGGQRLINGVKDVLGQPKIIMVLRDPVERLWSQYTFQRSRGNVPGIRSFVEYITACEQRRPDAPIGRLGLAIGLYSDYIGLWLDAFRADIKIVFSENLLLDPASVVGDLFRWLDLEDDLTNAINLRSQNVTMHARSPQIARVVYSLKRTGDHLRLFHPAVRDWLRRAYVRVNSGELPERLDPLLRERVATIYQASNRATAKALAAHGYTDLPPWLLDAAS